MLCGRFPPPEAEAAFLALPTGSDYGGLLVPCEGPFILTIALPSWFGPTVTIALCLFAIWRGGLEERLAAANLWLNTTATHLLRDYSWPQVQPAGFVADVLSLVLLLAIALRSRKYWPLAAAAFQLLMVITHIAKLIDPDIGQWSYLTAIVIWTHLLNVALGVGIWNAWRARSSYSPMGEAATAPR